MRQIEATLWNACGELRGVIAADAYSDCVLALFFLRYVFDVERDRPLNAPPRFVVPNNARLDALVENSKKPGNAARIESALLALERSNPNTMNNLFAESKLDAIVAHKSETVDRALGRALELLGSDTIDLSPSHVGEEQAPAVFEFLMTAFPPFSSPNAAEFYTPREISRLMVQLVNPRPGDSLYDPVSGSGSLLLTAVEHIRERYGSRDYMICGQEIKRSSWRLSKVNALLRGEDKHRIECGDTLGTPLHVKGNSLEQFDVVLANPPFSINYENLEAVMATDPFGRFSYPLSGKGKKSDYAFILHMVASMKPGSGRVTTIAPHGVLFRGGVEGEIRRNLIERNLVDAIIGLPPKLFYNTAIPAVIIYFRANRIHGDPILFVDASRDFGPGRLRNELRHEDIERIVTTYQRRASLPGYSVLVSQRSIADNDFNLNIPRYVMPVREELRIDVQRLAQRQQELGQELETMRGEIDGLLDQLGLVRFGEDGRKELQ
jgi:type I restriction enzyme M protein